MLIPAAAAAAARVAIPRSPILNNFSLLQHSVDRLMNGDTYNYKGAACGDWEFPHNPCPNGLSPIGGKSNASNFSLWLTHYHNTVVNSKVARDKVAIAMMATTEAGVWNCWPETMRQRVAQMLADKVPELAIFELFPDPKGKCANDIQVRVHIIRNAHIENVGQSRACMVLK